MGRQYHLERAGCFLLNVNITIGITVMKVPGRMQILTQVLVVVAVIEVVIVVVGVVVVAPVIIVRSRNHCRRRRNNNNNICIRKCNN